MKSEQTDNGLIDKAWGLQHNLESRQKRIGKGKYGRVLKMARKPTSEEYNKTSMITGIGILLIGGLGFLVWILSTQIAPMIANFFGNI
ncbi:MAG: protein translocase SEC61 complex subunit gamma [Candidatus Thermoplasmatota archaeon]|nr:protein translocase SEC61 complex subunit gamma [Candidatus Thermoplasmatota archaeon]